jgi:hypothetical protein
MAKIGGPKGSDPTKVVGGKLVPFPQVPKERAPPPEIKGETDAPTGFDRKARGAGTVVPEPTTERAPGGHARARLTALGQLPIKTVANDVGRIKDTPLGKIFDGSLTIESIADLKKLDGVVRINGDLTLQENIAKSADLLALTNLIELDGRLAIEGCNALGVLDALAKLERAGGVYIGFCDRTTRITLPSLQVVEGAFIVEHMPALVDISLPTFSKGGRYFHVHECPDLTAVRAGQLRSLEDELSLINNPHLVTVNVGSRENPARVARVELRGNGAASFAQLFSRA